jgi:hypothetical protein
MGVKIPDASASADVNLLGADYVSARVVRN